MLGEGGFISKEGVDHLRWLWQSLDPSFSLLPDVVEELNRFYAERQARFESELGGVFKPIARLICWDFGVRESDLTHALSYLDPPEDRVVRLFGLIDIGEWLARLLPLGSGGSTRARVHLVVFANRLWRHSAQSSAATAAADAAPAPLVELFSWRFWVDAAFYFRRIGTLYHSIIVCRFAPPVIAVFLVQYIGRRAYRNVHHICRSIAQALGMATVCAMPPVVDDEAPPGSLEQSHGLADHKSPRNFVFATLGCLWLIGALTAYREVMMPRVAMLTVNTHRTLIERGYLQAGDYTEFVGVLS